MVRREVLRGLFAGSAAMAVTACGGGSGGQSAAPATGTAPPPAPTPAPAPPPPPPVATLRGVTIDQAESEIAAPVRQGGAWLEGTRTVSREVTVTNADEFQAAVTQFFDTTANPTALAAHQRILCAWNGASAVTGSATRVTVGGKTLTTSHLEQGGSLTVAAAPGYSPDFANAVYVAGRGIHFQGIGFTRRAAAGEDGDALSGVVLFRNSTYPVTAHVAFDSCAFGSRSVAAAGPAAGWVNGLVTNGHVADFVAVRRCTFFGQQNAISVTAKALQVDQCDFQAVLQDSVAMRGHTFEADYFAHAWISRSTFRNTLNDWDARSQHSDTIQTGAANDRHLGYRLLVTDVVSHRAWRYGGENGRGGGSQGMYNDDHPTADNQFVVRRSTFLATTPHGFAYYSPQASRPSFIERSVFMRAGTVPSAFAPDSTVQDFAVGITGEEPANGPWLLVTGTVAKNLMRNGSISVTSVDPRASSQIAAAEKPEALFRGRDFGRAIAAVNGMANKFGYQLPNEAGSQASFVDDVMKNFEALDPSLGVSVASLASVAWRA